MFFGFFMFVDNSAWFSYNIDRKGAADKRLAPQNLLVIKEITAKFLRLGRLFLFYDRVCNEYYIDN